MNNKSVIIQNSRATSTPKKALKEDVFIISYPKSGRTWLRSILGKYLSLRHNLPEELMLETEKATKMANLPVTTFEHDGSAMNQKRHYTELYFDRSPYADKKVLLLGRDIKDTLVSAYFQATKRIQVFDGSMSEFIRSERYGARKLLSFYDVWRKSKSIPKHYMFVRYEDMHALPIETSRAILEFIGEQSVDETALQKTVDFCSFDNMQRMEKQKEFKSSILSATDTTDPESFKVRKGKVGGYTEYLNEDDIRYIDDMIREFDFDFSQLS